MGSKSQHGYHAVSYRRQQRADVPSLWVVPESRAARITRHDRFNIAAFQRASREPRREPSGRIEGRRYDTTAGGGEGAWGDGRGWRGIVARGWALDSCVFVDIVQGQLTPDVLSSSQQERE